MFRVVAERTMQRHDSLTEKNKMTIDFMFISHFLISFHLYILWIDSEFICYFSISGSLEEVYFTLNF